ncbi:MAG: adenylate/guanylate cyclase domain-containing protein, partial [Candidatus Aminicenantes bacterium]|nr:adenylate/guanylate cyclase domain-containing protein [Candidatus Aminicenantes bacterium]
AVLAVLGLDSVRAFDRLEWKSWDARMKAFADPAKASKEILLVFVDQPSLDFYAGQGITWPWPRGLYGALVRHLAAGGAKAVFFDITMTETSRFGEGDDGDFAAACAEAGNVFLPVFLSTDLLRPEDAPSPEAVKTFREKSAVGLLQELKGVSPAGGPEAREEIFHSVTLPVPVLLDASRAVVNVRVNPDPDTIYRRIPLFFPFRGEAGIGPPENSFFVGSVPAALALSTGSEADVLGIPVGLDRAMVIRFLGPAGTYRSLSAAAVINSFAQIQEGQIPQIPASEFRDKIVLVGLSAVGLLDIKASPISGVVPGVEIQAAALDTILNKRAFRFLPGFLTRLYFVLLALAAGWTVSILRKPGAQTGAFAGFLLAPAAASAAAFAGRVWLDFVAPLAAVFLTIIGAAVLNYMVEGRERRFLKGAFHHYLSPAVIDRIIADPGHLKLGGEQREVTSFFSDVAGFTSISEALGPSALVALLNEYLTEMTDLILDSGGTLDKYEGDAIIAFWNAPLDDPDHALRAARTALACRARVAAIGPALENKYGRMIRMRIGLNTGPAIVGNMGSSRRFDYTAMGDTINLASRLESAGKQYGVSLLAGESTVKKTGGAVVAREVDVIRVVGKREPVRIFELMGEKGHVAEDVLGRITLFHQGLERFRARDFARAEAMFDRLSGDPVAALYLERCRMLAATPPPDDWDFIFDLKTK